MKKMSVISLSLLSIALVACGKESDFKKAINTQLSTQSYQCLYIFNPGINSYSANDDDLAKLKEKTKNAYVVQTYEYRDGKTEAKNGNKKEVSRLDALVSAGLLTKSSESLPTNDYNKKPNGYDSYDVYNLTDAGKATGVQVKADGMSKVMFGDNGNRIFCYAHKEVNKIENFTEMDYMGRKMAEVKYSYQYVDIADWINKPGIQEAFPEIKEKLDGSKEDKMLLGKTNNGWEYGYQ